MTLIVKGPSGFINIAKKCWSIQKPLQVSGGSSSFWELCILNLIYTLYSSKANSRLIIVLPSVKDVNQWFNVIDSFKLNFLPHTLGIKSSYILSFFNGWGTDRFSNQNTQRRQRIQTLFGLCQNTFSVIFTTLQGIGQYTLPQQIFSSNFINLKVGDIVNQDALAQQLEELGYVQVSHVDEIAQYSIRGSIFDIFSLNYDKPLRIEFFIDKIKSIRFFDENTQSSDAQIDNITITPAQECIIPQHQRSHYTQILYNALLQMNLEPYDQDAILKYFASGVKFLGEEMFYPILRDTNVPTYNYLQADKDILLFPKGIEPCLDEYNKFLVNNEKLYEEDKKFKKITVSTQQHYCSLEQITKWISDYYLQIEGSNPYSKEGSEFVKVETNIPIIFNTTLLSSHNKLLDKWIETFKNAFNKEEISVLILAPHEETLTKIKNILNYNNLKVSICDDGCIKLFKATLSPSEIYLSIGDISSAVFLEENNVFIISAKHLLGKTTTVKEPVSKKIQNYLSILKEIKHGDLVVHVEHGIGRYCGIKTLNVNNNTLDFVVIEYADSDKLYVPTDKLNLIQKYTTSLAEDDNSKLKLDKLKSGLWEKRKNKVKKAVKDIAAELLKIYAKRKLATGIQISPIGDDYHKFEQAFPYEETPDQLRAIAEVNNDLDSPYPMDRLICGDVGFGKTEVALRAIYRVVYDGYQVLVLVPTTVLCYQHYRTFTQRLGEFGISVEQVNRFIEKSKVKEILKQFKEGNLDVLIGTHRLLSSDVGAKNLGLLIIDEEQRFGVMHKEKLKALQYGCNVLTLTATPIPRTLHMAMLGLRDISIIATPPQDRLPIKTFVANFDENIIKQAILFEVKRGGQVFFVHNRVENINEMHKFLSSLVPQIDIRVAHGQLGEHKLEKVILDFLDQKFSVLLCTTIIEAGVDMPNVNTLIVNRADQFGLAQLYQLRGRVGRSDRQAYAYFLTPKDYKITNEAKSRLEILSSLESLGVGFQIASYDLDIRGAGNLLGAEQSGYIAEVGIDLYTQMLEEAIEELSNTPQKPQMEPEIKLPISAFIPSSYVPAEHHRLQIYRKIFHAQTLEDILNLKKELEDRFGKIPQEVSLLFKIAELKRLLRTCKIVQLHYNISDFSVDVKFNGLSEKEVNYILTIVSENPTKYRLKPDYKLSIKCDKINIATIESQIQLVDDIIKLLDPLAYKFEVELNETISLY